MSVFSSGASITDTGNISFTWQVNNLDSGERGMIIITTVVSPNLITDALVFNSANITSTTEDTNLDNNQTKPATVSVNLPRIAFESNTYNVNEGDNLAIIMTTLDVIPFAEVTVSYITTDNTAIAGNDYETTGGILTFVVGSKQQIFTIPVTDDTSLEANETVTLTLNNPNRAILDTPDLATLTIIDNDTPVFLPIILKN
jgi:hypothetical protein